MSDAPTIAPLQYEPVVATGLHEAEVFAVGNLIGETGNATRGYDRTINGAAGCFLSFACARSMGTTCGSP